MSPNVEVIDTSELGDRSYVAHDGEVAVVIDPQRDLDRVERVIAALGVRCELVLETHIHNDYVSGGLELARRSGARYGVAGSDSVRFDRLPLCDGDELLTGGSLLHGSVGRTDLVDEHRTEELTRAQFRSARRLVQLAADEDRVFPTHGFGSFCSTGSATGGQSSTIGAERDRNDALTEDDENTFVQHLIANLTAYPSYYAHMDARNREGAGPADLSLPAVMDPEQLRERISAGQWVVDLRDRGKYALAHIGGSIGIALGPQFSTYLGWLIPWATPVTLIGDTAEQVSEAQRQLVRIGIDRPDGAGLGSPLALAHPGEIRSYPRTGFAELAAAMRRQRVIVLDVRGDDERARGEIPGSTHIPLYSLPSRRHELPIGTLWVHCASGYRASIAASLLDREGYDVVLVDDDYAVAVQAGLATG